jgi:hypothetical protein
MIASLLFDTLDTSLEISVVPAIILLPYALYSPVPGRGYPVKRCVLCGYVTSLSIDPINC